MWVHGATDMVQYIAYSLNNSIYNVALVYILVKSDQAGPQRENKNAF